jgi:hypothetical protein
MQAPLMACNFVVPYIVEYVCALRFCTFIMSYPVLARSVCASLNGGWADICLMVKFCAVAIVNFYFIFVI